MKTSELKKWLKENRYEFIEIGNEIHFKNDFNQINIAILTDEQRIYVDKWFYEKYEIELLNKIVEYLETPLSEREDEKKYRIKIDNTLSKDGDYLTLILNENTYYFSIFKTNSEIHQRIFTQQEIDNFPKEIKGAIECGFLRKVEVE